MADELRFSIEVDDNGTAVIKQFTGNVDDSTQSMGKMGDTAGTTGDSMTKMAATVTVAIGALTYLAEKAIEVTKRLYDMANTGATLKDMGDVFMAVSTSYGIASDKLLADLDQISHGTVATSTLMQTSTKAMLQGFSGNQIKMMMEDATGLSKLMGVDVATAFDRVATGIETLRTRQLKQLGIVIDTQTAYKNYALQIGVAVSALSEEGKMQALLVAEHEQTQRKLESLGETEVTASMKLQAFGKAASDVWDAFKKGIGAVGLIVLGLADIFLGTFNTIIASAQKWIGTFTGIIGAGMKALAIPGADAVKAFSETMGKEAASDWTRAMGQYKSAMQDFKYAGQIYGIVPPEAGGTPGAGVTPSMVDRNKATADAVKAQDELLKEQEKQLDVEQKIAAYNEDWKTTADIYQKHVDLLDQILANKIKIVESNANLTPAEKAQLETETKRTEELEKQELAIKRQEDRYNELLVQHKSELEEYKRMAEEEIKAPAPSAAGKPVEDARAVWTDQIKAVQLYAKNMEDANKTAESLGTMRPSEAGLKNLDIQKQALEQQIQIYQTMQDQQPVLAKQTDAQGKIRDLEIEIQGIEQQRLKFISEYGSAWEGFEAGLTKYFAQLPTTYTTFEQMATTMMKPADEISSAFSTMFSGIISGTTRASDAFKTFANSIVNSFTKMISDMIAQYMKTEVMKGFSSIWSGISGAIIPSVAPSVGATGVAGGGSPLLNVFEAEGGIIPGRMLESTPIRAFEAGGIAGRMLESYPFRSFQTGGVATTPTLGVFGEGGGSGEAFVPLESGKIPVQLNQGEGAGGKGGGAITVINITANDARSFHEKLVREGAGAILQTIYQNARSGGIMKNISRGMTGG